MDNKADIKMSVKAIAGLLLGLVVLLVLVLPSIGVIWQIFFPNTSQLTEESFNVLSSSIEDLELNETDSSLLYLEGGNMLVAFDKSSNSASGTAGYYERPAECFNKACVVVCEDSSNRDACLNPNLYFPYEFFDSFTPTKTDTGIVSLGKGDYVTISLYRDSNNVKIYEEAN